MKNQKFILFAAILNGCAIASVLFFNENLLPFITVGLIVFLLNAILLTKTKGSTFKSNFSVFITIPLITILTTLAPGAFEIYNSFFITATLFLCAYFWLQNKGYPKFIMAYLLLSPVFYCVTFFSIRFGSILFYPIGLAPYIGVGLALLAISILPKKRIVGVFGSVIIAYVFAYVVYPQYIYYFTGKKTQIFNPKYLSNQLITHLQDTIRFQDIKQKVVVLDFWHAKCGACFNDFPKYSKLFQKYAGNKDVLFAAINFPIKGEKGTDNLQLISAYQFNKFYTIELIDNNKWNIELYPTTYIFDSKRSLRFEGLLNYESGINNVNDIIEELLKE